MALRKLLVLLLTFMILPGCASRDMEHSESTHQNSDAIEDSVRPTDTPSIEGTVKTFEFEGLSLEISNVLEMKKGTSFDGMENWEYDIYVVSSGAVARVLAADTFIDEESGLPHPNWAFLNSNGERIDIIDNMASLEITEDILGIFDTESNLYILGFEMYNTGGTK